MTWFRWWHRHIRLITKPKSPQEAQKWSQRLAVLYMFFAWNAAGLVIYKMANATKTRTLTEEEKKGLSKGQQLALEMEKTNAKIVSITNFNVEVKDAVLP